jgi:hypothetical protein
MKTEAWCKICGTDVANIITLSFKIDDLAFTIKLYCKKIPNGIMKKQIGVKILKQLVSNSTYISIYDHLSSYVFDKSYRGHLVNISENQILIGTANRMRRILNNFKYDSSKKLEDQTKTIYDKIWKPNIKM